MAPKGKTDEEEGGEEERAVVDEEQVVAKLVATGPLGDVCVLPQFSNVLETEVAVGVGGGVR